MTDRTTSSPDGPGAPGNGTSRPAADWADFESRLGAVLARLGAGHYLVVAADEESPRAPFYVQFAHEGSRGLLAEAVSNDYLPGPARLTDAQQVAMRALGWRRPARRTPGPANYRRRWPAHVPRSDLAELAVGTLRDVFGIAGPGELRYRFFARGGGASLAEPGLGIAPMPSAEHTHRPATPGPEPLADGALDVAAIVAAAMAGDPAAEADEAASGSWRTWVAGVSLHLRVLPGVVPQVRVFAPVMRVAATPGVLATLNELNVDFSFGRALHTNGAVFVAMDVAGVEVTAEVLRDACALVARQARWALGALTGRGEPGAAPGVLPH